MASVCTDKHNHKFRIQDGDRAKKTFAEAIELANLRARKGGVRQRVTRHTSAIFRRGIWMVQDVHGTWTMSSVAMRQPPERWS